jgi:phosphatidylethanolamine/phosphatidyl-N-methylethanolamine N-methyltransferase
MALKHSYTVLAPVYDAVVSGPIDSYRIKSLARIKDTSDKQILINGIGSGLDIPYLADDACYIGTDITPAMLQRAEKRAQQQAFIRPIDISFQLADSQSLPFADDAFDAVVMHLILAVVPRPDLALIEACRVLKPGGRIYIFDKFIRTGQYAIGRRLLNILLRHIATRTDVIFEQVLANCPQLTVIHDEPALAKGWFRLIELNKNN